MKGGGGGNRAAARCLGGTGTESGGGGDSHGVGRHQRGVGRSGARVAARAILHVRSRRLIRGPVDEGGIRRNPRGEHSRDDRWKGYRSAEFIGALVCAGALRARGPVKI